MIRVRNVADSQHERIMIPRILDELSAWLLDCDAVDLGMPPPRDPNDDDEEDTEGEEDEDEDQEEEPAVIREPDE